MPYRLIPRRLRERVGRRGLVLLLFGITWVVQGVSYFTLTDLFAGQPKLFPIDHLPLSVQGWLWIVSGVTSTFAALRPRRENDTPGFIAVSSMPLILCASYLIGAITYVLAGSRVWVLGALGFLAWAPIVLALAVVASWYEPPIIGHEDE